jgi:hypothetical protein
MRIPKNNQAREALLVGAAALAALLCSQLCGCGEAPEVPIDGGSSLPEAPAPDAGPAAYTARAPAHEPFQVKQPAVDVPDASTALDVGPSIDSAALAPDAPTAPDAGTDSAAPAPDAAPIPEPTGLNCWGSYGGTGFPDDPEYMSELEVPVYVLSPQLVQVAGLLAEAAIPGGQGGLIVCNGGFPERTCTNASFGSSFMGGLSLTWSETARAWLAQGSFTARRDEPGGVVWSAQCAGAAWAQQAVVP